MTAHDRYVSLRAAGFEGFLWGVAILTVLALVRSAVGLRRSAALLEQLGITGVWESPNGDGEGNHWLARTLLRAEMQLTRSGLPGIKQTSAPSLPGFAPDFLRLLVETKSLDAISADGLDVFRLLSKDGDPRNGPHPQLQGTTIRLLVIPPRSNRVDPERQRVSCAEVALARIERSPEEHWRLLSHSLSMGRLWSQQHGIHFEVRFLESRPTFAYLKLGTRVWMRPWTSRNHNWLELQDSFADTSMAGALRDVFSSEWSLASASIEIPLSGSATGSTVIRRGVDVPAAGDRRPIPIDHARAIARRVQQPGQEAVVKVREQVAG